MPPKGENLNRKERVSEELDQKTFSNRLLKEDKPPLDKEGVFRSGDGRFLSVGKISRFFKDTLVRDVGLHKAAAEHVSKIYTEELLNALSQSRKKYSETEDISELEYQKELSSTLAAIMRDISSDPSSFGINIENQKTPRHLLKIDPNNLLELLDDSENVSDPLYVDGRLPMPKPLGDACKRAFEIIYPETDETTKRTITLLKERCVNQLVRELEEVDRISVRSKSDLDRKNASVDNVVERMTSFMRHALSLDGIKMYVEGIRTGVLPNDAVSFPTITKRPSYDAIENAATDKERWTNTQEFYKKLSESYSQEELDRIVAQFDSGSNDFFRDDAGVKAVTHIYYDLLKVFSIKGISEEDINKTFLPYVQDLVKEMLELRKITNDEYRKGFERDQKVINMNKLKLGDLRKNFLKKGKEHIDNIDVARLLVIDSGLTPESVLASSVSEVSTEMLDEDISFTCVNFADIDERLESLKVFQEKLESVLEPLRKQRNANELSNNDSFIKLRDDFNQSMNVFSSSLKNEAMSLNEATLASRQIVEIHSSLVEIYESQIASDVE